MSEPKAVKNNDNTINPSELRRKIIRIAKELFLNPVENDITSKSKAPAKRAITSKLTQAEKKYINEKVNYVFPKEMPERLLWDVYKKKDMEKRREVLLRIVAEDNAIIIEKQIVSMQPKGNKKLPTRQQVLERLSTDEKEILKKYRNPILSTTKSLDELSNSDRLYFLENGTLPTQQLVQAERQDIYLKYVNEQKEFFETYLEFVNKLLCELKKYRKVQDRTTMTARIKGTDSALKNDNKKALDDIFGIETIYSTDLEKSQIEKIVASTIDVTQEKEKKKTNGYQAYHICGIPTDLNKQFENTKLYKKISELYNGTIFYPNLIYNVGKYWDLYKDEMINKLEKSWRKYNDNSSNESIDINEIMDNLMIYVEIQSKSFEKAMVAIHGSKDDISAAHYAYEALDKDDEDLSKEEIERRVEEFKEYIQEKYTNIIKMNDGELPASMVPYMKEYLLDGTSKILDPMETLMHIYPFFIDPKYLEVPQQVQKKDEDRENLK